MTDSKRTSPAPHSPAPVLRAAPRRLRQPEPELVLRLQFVVRRVACSGGRRSLGRKAEVREDAPHRLALGEDGEHAKSTAALGTGHHVDGE